MGAYTLSAAGGVNFSATGGVTFRQWKAKPSRQWEMLRYSLGCGRRHFLRRRRHYFLGSGKRSGVLFSGVGDVIIPTEGYKVAANLAVVAVTVSLPSIFRARTSR